jgi:2-methylcitrate dehydratase PrpD
LIAYGERVVPTAAALVNGAMAHALDFDDTHDLAHLHSSVCVLPSALAAAELVGAEGKELVTAFILGSDLQCRLSLALEDHTSSKYGWAYTTTTGVFGAAAAAAKIFQLDDDKMLNALGIAYCEASGNAQPLIEGTLAKRLQPGFAAQKGLQAAMLAESGITGPKKALEGDRGFYKVYFRGEYLPEKLTDQLGQRFEVSNLSLKPYPSCRCTHAVIDAMLQIKRDYQLKPEEIDHIYLCLTKTCYRLVFDPPESKHVPKNIVDAQFSAPYTAACAIVNGKVSLQDFTDTAIKSKEVLALAQKVTAEIDEEAMILGKTKGNMVTIGKIHSINGSIYERSIERPKGHPENPMSKDEIEGKFTECARYAAKPIQKKFLDEVLKKVDHLEELRNINDLMKLV